MISQEKLIQILTLTFNGETSEQVHQAEKELMLQYQYPEFPSLICQMIETTFAGNSTLCYASVIQLKRYLIANTQFLVDQGIGLLIQLTLSLPSELQPVLETIADTICQFYNENDIGIIQSFQTLLQSNSPISGFILLNSLLNIYSKCQSDISQEEYDNIGQIINTEFQMVQQILENSADDQNIPLYLHYFSTSCVYQIIHNVHEQEQMNLYYLFSIQIIESSYESPIFDIPSDFFEVIFNCVTSCENSFDQMELDPIPFLSCSGTYIQNSTSLTGLTQFYKTMRIFLRKEETFSALQQNLQQIIESFFFPVFQISEEDQLNFEAEPSQFLESVIPSFQEEETPKSSAISCLYHSSEISKEIIPNIIFNIIIQILGGDSQLSPWDIFSIILFFSSCSQFFSEESEEFNQFIDQVISSNLESENEILICSSLIFLANFPTSYGSMLTCNHPFVTFSINTLAETASHPIICYLSCCATGHLLSLLKDHEQFDNTSSLEVPQEVLGESIQNLFIFNQQFPTERIAQAISSFLEFFTQSEDQMLGQFTEQAISTLMDLLNQYMHDETEEARKSAIIFSNAIRSLCTKVNISDQSIFDFILEQIDGMVEDGLSELYIEEILPLIDGCVKGNGGFVNEQIISIPQKLFSLMEGETAEALQISQIYSSFVLKFIDKEGVEISSLISPILEMVPQLIEEADMSIGDELEAIMNFTQLLFIFISHFIITNQIECDIDLNQCIAEWIQPLSTIDYQNFDDDAMKSFAADSLSAMIQFSPIAAFNDTELPVFNNWIEYSRPKAFLSSAMSVLINISSLQNLINDEQKQLILEKAQGAISILASENGNNEEEEFENENKENDVFFDMDSIQNFFREMQTE